MKYGLSDKQLQEIITIISTYLQVEQAVLFGSRAIDTYKEASDVDIAIKGEQATLDMALQLKDHLEEETYLPFFFDIIAYNTIRSDELKKHINTKGIGIYDKTMREWKEIALGKVLQVKYGKDHKKLEDGDIPCLGSGGIMRFVDTPIYEKESILIPRKGSLNNIMYQNKPFWTVDTMFWSIIDTERVFPKFLYYQLTLIDYTILNVGSAVPSLTVPIINEIDINLPPLPEQKAIAEVLSSLDDKIDLLHRQNQTLEAMAETLFRQWFVEEDNGEDWQIGTLKDEFEILMGQSPPGSSYNKEKRGMPMYQGNKDFGFRFPSNRVFTSEPKRIAIKKDTLISVCTPVGAQNMANEECCIGRGVAAFRHKEFSEFCSYTYFKMRYMLDDIRKFNNEGTVFGSISKSDFEKMETEIPSKSDLEEIQSLLNPIDGKVISNCIQIQTLINLRNTLLPKLMSGEVRVKQ